jgi:hypothetical protein
VVTSSSNSQSSIPLRPLTLNLRLDADLIPRALARLELAKALVEVTGVRCI